MSAGGAVIDAITAASREQNAACGRELMAIGELYARRAPEDDEARICWAVDGHANLVAELSAALNISRGRAAARLRLAIDLRERLPKVGALFAGGAIDYRMVTTLVNRADLVTDPEWLARLDEAFARWAPTWMKLSGPKLYERVDMWVERFDPTGVREPKTPSEDVYVEVGPISPGVVGIWARLAYQDGVAFDTRLDAMASGVCRDDPRSKDQRRADALMAMASGRTRLACRCGAADCPHRGPETPAPRVVINVIAEQATLEGRSNDPGYLPGYGAVPAALLREQAPTADVRLVTLPSPYPEDGYRPSAQLARFVRMRDLTCRFPGCDVAAAHCQIDHTIPYPIGPTHPSNLKLLCVFHHLLKTFWTGPTGWADLQLPDGTVVWRAPIGRMYTTRPAGAEFFAQLARPTGEIRISQHHRPDDIHRGVMMPRRKRTRAQDKAYRVARERRRNTERLTAEELFLAERLARDDEPPPF